MKLLRIIGNNLANFMEGTFDVNFVAMDRVPKDSELYCVGKHIYLQNTISFVGVNASGKTKTLNMIEYVSSLLLNKVPLNSRSDIPFGVVDGTEFKVYFLYENDIIEWYFTIGILDDGGRKHYYYKDEVLKGKSVSAVKNKQDIFIFDDMAKGNLYQKRSELSAEIIEMMPDDSSITIKFNKDKYGTMFSLANTTNLNIMAPNGMVPKEVIALFDTSIEYLNCEQKNTYECELKFKNIEEVIKLRNLQEAYDYLSSGTIKGNTVYLFAIGTLLIGGYLIIDEIENHFHKELVKLLLDLFKSKSTNPKGATLIFSTHYAEILDVIDRKDNIYILRKNDYNINLLNYSKEIKRNDLKKSDVLLSGVVKGTIPKYENINDFKGFLWKKLQEIK